MGTISVSLPADGTTADVADYNTPITTIVNEFNGNIDDTNVKSAAAIAGSKVTDKAGHTVQTVGTTYTEAATGTTIIPSDDTIPQNTEGTEFMTQAITPKSASNILYIEAVLFLASGTASRNIAAALFQDSTANALAAARSHMPALDGVLMLTLKHKMTAGTGSATTFKVRAGPDAAATITFNGASGARNYGAIVKSLIEIREVAV